VQNSQIIHYAIVAVIVALVLGLRLRGMSRMRRLRLETLWIVPAVYLIFAIVMFSEFPPSLTGWAIAAVALVVGAAIGWQRGKLMQIHVDPETHQLNQRASPAAILFIFALIVVRMAARGVLANGTGTGFHVNAMLVTDVLIALAVGLFAATRLEMYLRAKRLLEEARTARPV
jgi:energy-converting hydrogenase Eha subunit A